MTGTWTTSGFDGFARGTCGNAGHNLYVSRAGILQRIHQYDFTGDGNLDLVFCNSQDHWERPPAYVYRHPLGDAQRLELPADAARSGAVADLNGDGCDDLVLGMGNNGIRGDLNARIYYGGPEGWSERRQQLLPVPMCTSVAVGDYNRDGRPDLAFLSNGRLRLFHQSDLGFESKRFVDVDIAGQQLTADDLDGDGYCDLVVRAADGETHVYWGGDDGFSAGNRTLVPIDPDPTVERPQAARFAEYVPDAEPLVRVLLLGDVPHLFVARTSAAYLVPLDGGRGLGSPVELACHYAMSAALGDVNGNGHEDLVIACRHVHDDGECSWVYWGDADGFDDTRRTAVASENACDVAAGDLDGDGRADVVLCQCRTEESYTTESLIYRGAADGLDPEPARLVSEDARRVFLGRPSGEGDLQVAFANHYARGAWGNVPVSIYLGDGTGFSPDRRLDLPAWGAIEAVCCDIDDDGRADLVIANAAENSTHRDPGSYVVGNGPDGIDPTPAWTLPTTRAHGVCCADLDRDGYLDLVFCGFFNPEILVFHGTEDGFDVDHPQRIVVEHEGKTYDELRWVYLADLDNDGWLDLVVPMIDSDRSFVLWGGPDGFSMQHYQVLAVNKAACARAADLNGNGYLDLVMGGHMPTHDEPHDTFLTIYWNGPDGLREDRRTLLPAYGANAMAIADFDGDGTLDLFACSYHDGRRRDIDSYLYWNRPDRGFSEEDFTRMFTHSASGCVADDFDEDGRVDLAIAYHKVWGDHVGHSAVWRNGPDGLVEGEHLPTSGPHGMTSVGPGNIADRGPEEYYLSESFELPAGARVTELAWEATLPPKSWVRAQLRFADSEAGLEHSRWTGPDGEGSWYDNGQPVPATDHGGGWVQYRLALGARHSGSSPRVTEVRVQYDGAS